MRIVAISYSCRNLGQVALLWPGQPAPTGPGWIDVKAEPLVRLSDIEDLLKRCQSHICGGETSSASKRTTLEDISTILNLNVHRVIPPPPKPTPPPVRRVVNEQVINSDEIWGTTK